MNLHDNLSNFEKDDDVYQDDQIKEVDDMQMTF